MTVVSCFLFRFYRTVSSFMRHLYISVSVSVCLSFFSTKKLALSVKFILAVQVSSNNKMGKNKDFTLSSTLCLNAHVVGETTVCLEMAGLVQMGAFIV